MYSYEWDTETGGYVLCSTPLQLSKEPRPVYYRELDLLGFDKFWNYTKSDIFPYMWAEGNSYYYRGKLVARTKGGSAFCRPEVILEEKPEPDGERLKYVDIPGMVEKNRNILEGLVSETIKKIYNIYTQHRDRVDVFYVAFSGGKDSIVALDLVQRALPHSEFKVLFGDTGMEFPDTYEVVDRIEEFCRNEEIEFLRSKSHLEPEQSWRQFGPPAQTMRWCCSVHKTAPQILLLREYTNNPKFRGMAFTGVRGDESLARSEYESVSLGEKVRGQYSCHPILEWNSAELFAYIYQENLIINDAYKKGNSRAGCLVCPLAGYKNMYFKEQCYGSDASGRRTTTLFNDIILETTAKELATSEAIDEFMNIAGWKARRSGKELSIAKSYCEEENDKGVLRITLTRQLTDWREWIKTIGKVSYLSNEIVEILYSGKVYRMAVASTPDSTTFEIPILTNTKSDIYFMSALKNVFRKTAYCIGCKVCEANCPNGYITMENGKVSIDDRCVKCMKCHDVFHGCLVANSMRLPKGEKKMGSVDRYGNMGIEYEWVKKYFGCGNSFWESAHGLGTNMVKYLKSFLGDANITEKNLLTPLGEKLILMGVDEVNVWALMLCNLVYSAEFNWWIKNTKIGHIYTPEMITSMLDEDMSDNTRSHIVSAFKNIFISNRFLGTELGLGDPDYEIKGGKRYLKNVYRLSWQTPDPRVILYSLYKFAEQCGDYYQFTLTRLLDHDIDSDGVSPTEIFGLDRETMEKLLNGLSINYPDLISASFTLDLDNITLRNDKTSADVLELF